MTEHIMTRDAGAISIRAFEHATRLGHPFHAFKLHPSASCSEPAARLRCLHAQSKRLPIVAATAIANRRSASLAALLACSPDVRNWAIGAGHSGSCGCPRAIGVTRPAARQPH
jgi:hypothetical protein